jgi:hypothetical protein
MNSVRTEFDNITLGHLILTCLRQGWSNKMLDKISKESAVERKRRYRDLGPGTRRSAKE